MKVYLAKHHGFCYGVKRAVEIAQANAGLSDNIHTLGPIIHNPQVVNRLSAQGVKVADDLSQIKTGKVIIRSHGVGPSVYSEAEKRHLEVLDATCPHVKKAQQAAHDLLAKGYQVVVIGEKHHPEVKSIVEWSDNTARVVQTVKEAEQLPFSERLGVVVQTTFAIGVFQDIIAVLKTKCTEIKIEKTICNATEARQSAAVELAKNVDIMIVVGGKNSANTSRLADLCRQAGNTVYHIETSDELTEECFKGVETAGVTAGASTPDWIIEEVIQKMQEFDKETNQNIEALESGTIVQGKIISVRKDEVFVDIGYKAEGVIPNVELAYPVPENAADVVKEGDVIDVYVIETENNEGNVRLSKIRADKIVGWDKLEKALSDKETIDVKATEVVKGGIAVAVFGLRGFIPASQVGLRFIEDLSGYVGETLKVLPIEIDKAKNRIVLSKRAVLEEERHQVENEVFAKLSVNQTLTGKVTRLADFGAFVDIGGVEGLVHISELSWHRVKTPSEVVAVGDEVSVVVLRIDPVAKKLSLGLKQTLRDPWFDSVEMLSEGTVLTGTVSKLAKFGAFVKITDDVEGLVHISEISERRVANPADVLDVGQEVKVKIIGIDKANKRIALSISQAMEDAERAEYNSYLTNQTKEIGVTIGEKFGHLFKHQD